MPRAAEALSGAGLKSHLHPLVLLFPGLMASEPAPWGGWWLCFLLTMHTRVQVCVWLVYCKLELSCS